MGKMRDYFKRGFIGILNNEIEITIYKDEFDDNDKLINLECTIEETKFECLNKYLNKITNLTIYGAKTKTRNKEFNYDKRIKIYNITRNVDFGELVKFNIFINEID